MTIPIEIRIKIVLLMAKFESSTIVRRKLQVEFGNKTPSVVSIQATFERFCETGTVEDRERSGRPSKITEEKIDEVYDVLQNEPQSSVRVVATACSIRPTTAHKIMTEYLSMKPYKMQFVQELHEEDLQDRVEMCKTLMPMLQEKDTQENLFFSDEATFYLQGLVNKHNIRYWSETNPHVTIETAMKSAKLNVWCAMSKNHLIGPFFSKRILLTEKVIFQCSRTSLFQKSENYTRFVRLFSSRMVHHRILPVMYDNIWIINFLKGGLEEVVRFGGLHAHRI